MECAVITTYRCNARCQMCNIWQHPSRKAEEFSPNILEKLPQGIKRLNITGGEPMLREDIFDIVHILKNKTHRLEISTNGYFTDRIIEVSRQVPDITIRVSIEGLPSLNDELRGIEDGFDHALRTLLKLKEIGIKDIGFGIVISDKNVGDLIDLYRLVSSMGIEFGNATIHNSFYFHKADNQIQDVASVAKEMKHFIRALLLSKRPNLRLRMKDWGRAYINLGILGYILGKARPLPCGAAKDTFFVDPYGLILACNGSEEPWVMGDLRHNSFEEIWSSAQAHAIRERVQGCQRNCWMTGTAVPAMRKSPWQPARWVLRNKARLAFGSDISLS